MTALSLVVLGFVLGMRHATDADHVIAVTAIVARQRTRIRDAMVLGTLWGIGHTVTILLVGGALILFGIAVPTRLGLGMEMAVALMLVALGGWNLAGALRAARDAGGSPTSANRGLHAHPHSHGDYVHTHLHGHRAWDHGHRDDETPQAWLDARLGEIAAYQMLRPLIVGLVHGLAGSAAVPLLVLAIIPNPRWAIGYLAIFGIGTIVGMLSITAAIAAPLAWASARFSGIQRPIRFASGAMSVAFGLLLLYQIGFHDWLFIGNPP